MSALGLFVALAGTKFAAVGPHELFATMWAPIAFLWQDAATAAIFAIAEAAFPQRRRLLSAACTMAAAYVVLTVPVMRVLSTPVTRSMLNAAGGALADSIFYYATSGNLVWVVALAAAAAATSRLSRLPSMILAMGVVPIVALGPMATRHVDTRGLDRNAFTSLLNVPAPHAAHGDARLDWRFSQQPLNEPRAALDRFRGAASGRNVVMLSLESTAAQYLGLYGQTPDAMPNLSALAESAIVFDNAYAVYPESIKGLFSTMCSAYPAFNQRADIYADVPCPSVAGEAARHGYRAALFHSGRFRYLGMNAVIRNRGYELLADAGDIGGNHESSFGVDEPATVARMLDWIDRLDAGDRFFITYLPIAGHHPYATDAPGPFRDDTELGRYRNALHAGDAAIGELVRGIRARGLERETVWIVYGDHGEAFGQHPGNYGHTFQLYEENVRVPLLIAAPGLIPQQIRSRAIASLLDIAPTLLDVLGFDAPGAYAGVSLLRGQARAALFFADYSLGLAGVRDGELKVIYELNSGRVRVFDLAGDPAEAHNIAATAKAGVANMYVDRLKRWLAVELKNAAGG